MQMSGSWRALGALVMLVGCGGTGNTTGDAMPGDPDGGGRASPAYDVAYVDEMTMSSNVFSIAGLVAIVNKGSEPLDISNKSVAAFSDDSAETAWTFEQNGEPRALLAPEHMAGALSPAAKRTLVDSGLVPEPLGDDGLQYQMTFTGTPTTAIDLHGQVTLAIENKQVMMPFVIHLIPNVGRTTFDHASRLHSP